AEALRELDARYLPVDRVAPEPRQVLVLRCQHAAEAEAARAAAPDGAWLVGQLYRPEGARGHARDPLVVRPTAQRRPGRAAIATRAIDQPDLVTWYEVINPIRITTVDGAPTADDYSNVAIIVPDGHRMVAHAARAGGPAPECLPRGAERVLRSHDLWALARL